MIYSSREMKLKQESNGIATGIKSYRWKETCSSGQVDGLASRKSLSSVTEAKVDPVGTEAGNCGY